MKAFSESHSASAGRAGLILLIDGEVAAYLEARSLLDFTNRDEHNPAGILTSSLSLSPAFPAKNQWHWEFVARYSGATVPDSHGVP
jgi:hypothetical protein